ncbi:MAG: LysE family translocator [Pseudorhodoplanes sp.]
MPYLSPQTLAAFAMTSLIIELTPGPNMAFLAILSASQGRRAGVAATVGIALGLLLVGLAAALGLAAAISESPTLYALLRWGGVAYLLWLAWDGWRDASESSPARTKSHEPDTDFFIRGLITNLLNPKAAVFFVAMLPTFIDPARFVLWQTLLLTVFYVTIATGVHIVIVSLAGTARPFLEDPNRSRVVRRTLSLVLGLIAVWFALSSAHA